MSRGYYDIVTKLFRESDGFYSLGDPMVTRDDLMLYVKIATALATMNLHEYYFTSLMDPLAKRGKMSALKPKKLFSLVKFIRFVVMKQKFLQHPGPKNMQTMWSCEETKANSHGHDSLIKWWRKLEKQCLWARKHMS
jgi:hypothetical protein